MGDETEFEEVTKIIYRAGTHTGNENICLLVGARGYGTGHSVVE